MTVLIPGELDNREFQRLILGGWVSCNLLEATAVVECFSRPFYQFEGKQSCPEMAQPGLKSGQPGNCCPDDKHSEKCVNECFLK